uniref:Uncharacterized protein n=1 Tax=Trichogramma kaykai TaxID=54128 RepID=A0ABD2XM39_9HYME
MKALDWRSLISIASRASEEEKRRLLLDGIYRVVENWQGPLPDLLEIFEPKKIECLLSYAVTDQEGDEKARIRFIKFVVDTGYRDQPKVGTDRQYVLHRTTPIHLVLRTKIDNWDATATNMVQLLFEIYNRFDFNYIDVGGFTHFQAACSIPNGHQLVKKLIQNGQNPNSLLLSALQYPKWAAKLLIRGADPTWLDADGSTALHTICRDNRLDSLKLFFKIVDEHRKSVQINVRDSLGNTPLHLAVKSGFLKSSEILLTRGADPNSANKEGSTPLHIICRDCRLDLLKLFFEIVDKHRKSVQVNVRDSLGNTPLHLAVKNGFLKSFEILLRRGADPNSANQEGSTPLHLIATATYSYKLVEIFFKIAKVIGKPVWVNVQDKEGNTPLHLAIRHGNKRTSGILLENGANPNLADKDGCTALHLISNTRRYEAMKQFFETIDKTQQTVQLDARDNKGWTPLHMTLHSGSKKKFLMLLKRGADPNVTNQDGQTLLSLALLKANTKMAENLLCVDADPNLADNKGWTPLHIICIKCNWFLKKFFEINAERQKTVEINAKTIDGRTPLNLLMNRKTKYEEASRYLEALGAELD